MAQSFSQQFACALYPFTLLPADFPGNLSHHGYTFSPLNITMRKDKSLQVDMVQNLNNCLKGMKHDGKMLQQTANAVLNELAKCPKGGPDVKSKQLSYDVVVTGGGSAGVGAAIGAAQTGRRVLLLERNPYLGGQATHSSLPAYCGFFTQAEPFAAAVGGVGQQVLDKMASLGFYSGPRRTPRTGTVIVVLDSEAVKVSLDSCVAEAGVDVLLDTQIIGASVDDRIIRAVECVDDEGRFTVQASSFVDASGEGNLTAMSGGHYTIGDAAGNLQVATLMLRIGGVAAGADAHPVRVAEAVRQGKGAGIGPMSKELGTVIPAAGTSGDVMFILPSESANGLDAASLTRSEISARKQSWAYLESFRRFLPGFENAYIVQTGPKIGIRETRRVVGEYRLTAEDVVEARRFPDAIARGAWPVEAHTEPDSPQIWRAIRGHSYYEIPLRCLKVGGVGNLWAGGRIISCEADAFASVRVMGTCFATGQAAGVAAASASGEKEASPQNVRDELLRQNAII